MDNSNEDQSSSRRSFLRRLRGFVSVVALGGLASSLLGQQTKVAKALDGSASAGQVAYWFLRRWSNEQA